MITRRSLLGLAPTPAQTSLRGVPAAPSQAGEAATAAALAAGDPILHLLNRITYGPRPDEVARARAIGFAATIEEQLAPESLPDAECDQAMRRLAILTLDRRDLHKLDMDNYRAYRALAQGMITRAVLSRRQLQERMVEFWCDHFNVAGDDYVLDMVAYQRDTLRTHALGKFRDLLLATARSPAMLYYLDNASNVAEHPNENYARELLELHTLGVDGGYTETDVKEVARAFTGWTVHDGRADGFYFDPGQHDSGPKQVLGHALPAGRGIEDGLHVLSIVANHPSTARFLSRKLCVRFVSDSPPPALVDGAAAVWAQTGGDIRAVLRFILNSPEFGQSAGQKFRRPLEFLIAALRATGTEVHNYWALEEMFNTLGQPPFGWHPPNGYPDVAGAWFSTGGLLARWNTAMRLTHSAHSDAGDSGWGLASTLHDRIHSPATAGELVDQVAAQVFGVAVNSPARDAFVAFVADGGDASRPVDPLLLGGRLAGLFGMMIASPLFQWR